MDEDTLTILQQPTMTGGRMVFAFTGWMDGGEAATGTVDQLIASSGAELFAEIDPEPFTITNFPGSMEISALFRPHVEITGGLLTDFQMPSNAFHASESERLVLFRGKEPHFHWRRFADRMLEVAEACDVETIYYLGTFAGTVPHSREPRLYCSMSHASLKPTMEAMGARFSNYDGPGSFATYLTHRLSRQERPQMVSLVAEIPAYVQGRNPKCIEAMVRRSAALLGLSVDMDDLRATSDAFEDRLNEIVSRRNELAEQIAKLEAEYDNELFETQLGDLKTWLEDRGIRLD